jgi:hypothetical protein
VRPCFHGLPDPVVVNRCQQQRLDMPIFAILAVLSSADDWPDIETFAATREDWLVQLLELPGGISSHDTFRRAFRLSKRNQRSDCLPGMRTLAQATGAKLIAVDRKMLRRSRWTSPQKVGAG